MKTISHNNPSEANEYCLNIVKNIIKNDDNILYIGYSQSDIILDWFLNNHLKLTIIDKNMDFTYKYINIIRDDILNIDNDFIKTFDVIMLSFVLHENDYKKQTKILNKLNKNSRKIIIIEPLKLHNRVSRKIQGKILRNNHLKKYYADKIFYAKRLENIEYIEVIKCKNVNVNVNDSIMKLELPNLLFCYVNNKFK